jgi:hypothetical protein
MYSIFLKANKNIKDKKKYAWEGGEGWVEHKNLLLNMYWTGRLPADLQFFSKEILCFSCLIIADRVLAYLTFKERRETGE